MNTREFVNQDKTGQDLVSPQAETRDALGMLAVQVLASRCDLSKMRYPDMLRELHAIIVELHKAYDKTW